jgi:hypothetical protein
MTTTLAAAVLVSVATGFTLVAPPIARTAGRNAPSVLLALSLAVGVGLGISACALFAWLVLVGSVGSGFAALDGALLLAGLLVAIRWWPRAWPSTSMQPLGWPWRTAVAASMAISVTLFVVRSATLPHGDWDAWMTWNRTARFLFRGASEWRDAFASSFRHPDYPLLIPGAVARLWSYIGTDSMVAPAAVAMLFTFATVGLIGAALAVLRSRRQGVLAMVILLGTSSFVAFGTSQYADVPLSFFVLATVVLLCLHDRGPDARLMALAGTCAGFAAWTKNEGALFLAAVATTRWAAIGWRHGWRALLREARWFAAGAAPVLTVVAYFKVCLAPVNDLVAGQGLAETLPRLLEGGRYAEVGRVFATEAWRLGHNGIVGAIPVLVVYLLYMGRTLRSTDRTAVATSLAACALVLTGYVVVLIMAPGDFLRLLNRSVDRLLLHLWPAVVFTFFMVARPPEDAAP